jgi:hypothetical protein
VPNHDCRALRGRQLAALERRTHDVGNAVSRGDDADRNRLEPELLRGGKPGAPVQDDAVLGEVERLLDPVLGDRRAKLGELGRAVLGDESCVLVQAKCCDCSHGCLPLRTAALCEGLRIFVRE